MTTRKNNEPAVGIVVVTHEGAASCMLSAAQAIVGPLERAVAACVPVGEEFEAIVDRLSEACDAVEEGAGVLLMVDIHGSSPFHAATAMLDGTRPAEILCGVNLPMLIKLATIDRRETTPVALAEELREIGRRSIRLGSELTGKVAVGERR